MNTHVRSCIYTINDVYMHNRNQQRIKLSLPKLPKMMTNLKVKGNITLDNIFRAHLSRKVKGNIALDNIIRTHLFKKGRRNGRQNTKSHNAQHAYEVSLLYTRQLTGLG